MISADNTPDYDNIINVAIGSNVSSIDTFAGADPFAKSWDDLRTYSGLDDANAKRRMTRKANTIFGMPPTPKYEDDSKMQPSGIKEVGSKQINPGKEYATDIAHLMLLPHRTICISLLAIMIRTLLITPQLRQR